jgi:hypothetical protein
LKKYGYLTDNPNIGPDLQQNYWKCGNSEMFLDLVEKLTGKPLVADAWVEDINIDVKELIVKEKEAYEKMVI